MPKLITNTGTPISLSGATYVVGVARPTASYLYLADGTKVQAIGETGQGYEYLGSYSCTFSRLGIARANTALPSAYRKSSLRLSVNGSNADIESFPFAGGRIVKTTNGYEPQYYITDHLGSTRTVVKPNATVVAEFISCTFSRLGIARAGTALLSAYRKSNFRLNVNGRNVESIPFRLNNKVIRQDTLLSEMILSLIPH